MDIALSLVTRPSSGPITPKSRMLDSSHTEWRVGHLIQLLETIKDTGAMPKWKSERHVYLLALRDTMTPIEEGTRSPSACSYEDEEEMAYTTPETASTPISTDSGFGDIIIGAFGRKRKRSIASWTSENSHGSISRTNWLDNQQYLDDQSRRNSDQLSQHSKTLRSLQDVITRDHPQHASDYSDTSAANSSPEQNQLTKEKQTEAPWIEVLSEHSLYNRGD
ncbi:hypothetical protein MMC10_008269 [Thelotrema lepadinum]|nr:hypothetical protein [Thelotrema lepadinum]